MLAPFSPGPAPPAAPALFPAGGADLPEDPAGFGAAIDAVEAEEAPEAAAADALALLLPPLPPPAAPAPLPAGADSAVAPASGTPALPDAPALQPPSGAPPPVAETPAAAPPPATDPAARADPAVRPMVADGPDAPPPTDMEPANAAETTAPAAPKAGGATESALRHLLTEGQIAAPRPPDAPPQPAVTEAAPSPPRAAPAAAPAPLPQHQAAGALAALIRDSGAQVAGDARRIELVLTPEDLGRIRFDLTPGRDGLQVTLAAERPETLDLLRRHAGDLLAELEAAGYGGATLNFGCGGNPPAAAAPEPGPEPPDTPPTAPLPQPRPVLRAAGGLDLRL